MDRTSITPELRRFTEEGGDPKLTADAHRPAGVRPPDERDEVLPETLPTGASLDGLLRPGVESAGRCPSCGRTREGLQ